MKSYDVKTIEIINSSILEDEFNDASQNKNAYDNKISGENILQGFINHAGYYLKRPFSLLNVGAGQGILSKLLEDSTVSQIQNLEPCPGRVINNAIEGWCENIPLEAYSVNTVLCWGTLCFVRSLPETLIQFNKVLFIDGILIVDIVTYTTMPLAQTVNAESFIRYTSMFGFSSLEEVKFGPDYHSRVGFIFKKTENFNPARLRMPQSTGEIKNYLPERDWYLK
jgi:hypothetical protein